MKLIDRYKLGEVPRKGVWFKYGKWSILNCGELMRSASNVKELASAGVYMEWEAMKGDLILRRNNLQDLLGQLNPSHENHKTVRQTI